MSIKVLSSHVHLILLSFSRRTLGAHPVWSSSLDVHDHSASSTLMTAWSIILPNPPPSNFCSLRMSYVLGTMILDINGALILIQSTFFSSAISAYTILRIDNITKLLFTLGSSYRNWWTCMHRSLNSGYIQYFKFATLCFLWIPWHEGGNAFPMWHHSMNCSHVVKNHNSTTASQPWKALLFWSNRICKHFLWIFPQSLFPLSCSFLAILVVPHSCISPSIVSFFSTNLVLPCG